MADAGGTINSTETCKRELIIEVPADAVRREAERVTQTFQQRARVPGFRPGKTPASVVRQRFLEEIKHEVLRSLAAEHLRLRLREENLEPVNTPEIEDAQLELEGDEPLRFKAVFEVMPAFEMKDYTGLQVEEAEATVSEEEIETALKEIQEEQATYTPVEDRPLRDGDFAAISFQGKPISQEPEKKPEDSGPQAGKKPAAEMVKVNDVLCEIGGAGTVAEFTENLRGVLPGEEKTFPVKYPEDFSDRRLAGRALLYTVKVNAIKEKQVPELNDEFARDLGSFKSLEEVRVEIRQKLLEQKRSQAERDAKQKLLDRLVEMHDFPVPDSLVEKQIKSRMDRTTRQLAAQGVDPVRLNLDWGRVRSSHREAAIRDVKAGLMLERIAEREGIEVTQQEIERETEQLVRQIGGKDPAAARARLTRQGVADTIKSRLRNDKTLDFVYRKAERIPSRAGTEVRP